MMNPRVIYSATLLEIAAGKQCKHCHEDNFFALALGFSTDFERDYAAMNAAYASYFPADSLAYTRGLG